MFIWYHRGMKTRKRILPEGWYPASARQTEKTLASWPRAEENERKAFSCIVPHAGWFFSGALAYRTMSRLRTDVDTVVVVGGHLPSRGNLLAAPEEGYETPQGVLTADLELRAEMQKQLTIEDDTDPDNTVEVQLPLVAGLFPGAEVLWLRAPQSDSASRAGQALRRAADKLGKSVVVVGSTDLTHYGAGYGFMPRGGGPDALAWVKEENDGGIIRAFLDMDATEALRFALERKAACSVGGALAAMAFAETYGVTRGILEGYLNSADMHPSDSFVGYAGIVYG